MAITIETQKIQTKNDYELGIIKYFNDYTDGSKRVLLIGSATGIKSSYYKKLANYFAENGFFVISFDYYGIGDSLPKSVRKIKNKMQDWGEVDLNTVVTWIESEFRPEKLYYIGHSVAGQIIGLMEEPNVFDKIILVAAQIGYWKYYTKKKYRYALLYYILWSPMTRILGYFPGTKLGIGENLPKGVALQWVKWLKKENYLFDDKTIDTSRYSLITCPILAYSMDDDHYAPLSAVQAMVDHYTHASITYKHIKPRDVNRKKIGHFGFFREQNKDIFWNEALDFFTA